MIVVQAGTGIEVLEDVTVTGRVLGSESEDGKADLVEQAVGGWIMLHPDHWSSVKREIKRLQAKVGE